MDTHQKWTLQDKYKPYEKWSKEYVQRLKTLVQSSQWRQNFHIQPETGLLNDPNGFSYYNGRWYLFYQAFPYGTVHGLKSWYKVVSKDLVHWENQGLAILPDTVYDSHGVYSGSALPVKDKLCIFYTGNVRDEQWNRSPYQLGAIMDDETITKLERPLIRQVPKGYTTHFRDPQVFPYNGVYYLIVGAQTVDMQGSILVYQSKDLESWKLLGPLNFIKEKMGYMVECPQIVGLKEKPILIFCPQGLSKEIVNYHTPQPNVFLLASDINFEELTFEKSTELRILDDGFDVYATQAIDAPDGRILCVSWLGVPENEYPVSKDGWTNCLSLVKELKVLGNNLYQYPVAEINNNKKLIEKKESVISGVTELYQLNKNSYELEISFKPNQQGFLYLFSDEKHSRYLTITIDSKKGVIEVDRSKVGIEKIEETISIRRSEIAASVPIKMNIFVDTSSFEIFINDGLRVISGLAFPEKEDTFIFFEAENGYLKNKLWTIQ